jgi:hypothetical protein
MIGTYTPLTRSLALYQHIEQQAPVSASAVQAG